MSPDIPNCPECGKRTTPERGAWDISRVIGLPGAAMNAVAFRCPADHRIVFDGRSLERAMRRYADLIEAKPAPSEAESRFLRKYNVVRAARGSSGRAGA